MRQRDQAIPIAMSCPPLPTARGYNSSLLPTRVEAIRGGAGPQVVRPWLGLVAYACMSVPQGAS